MAKRNSNHQNYARNVYYHFFLYGNIIVNIRFYCNIFSRQKDIQRSHTMGAISWSTTEENLFISGSYDDCVKLWDIRSPEAPLFDLIGHDIVKRT